MSNKTYDKLKWFALIFIPALEALILTVGKIWAIPYYSEIGATVAALGVFLGALLNVSSKTYYKSLKAKKGKRNDTAKSRKRTANKDS